MRSAKRVDALMDNLSKLLGQAIGAELARLSDDELRQIAGIGPGESTGLEHLSNAGLLTIRDGPIDLVDDLSLLGEEFPDLADRVKQRLRNRL